MKCERMRTQAPFAERLVCHRHGRSAMILPDAYAGMLASFVNQLEPETSNNISRLLASARDALRRNDLQDSRHALEEAVKLCRGFMLKQLGFWAAQYENMIDARFNAIDALHDRLAERGQRAVRDKDFDELRQVVIEMHQNTIHDAAAGDTGILSGLMM